VSSWWVKVLDSTITPGVLTWQWKRLIEAKKGYMSDQIHGDAVAFAKTKSTKAHHPNPIFNNMLLICLTHAIVNANIELISTET
jgi:hypothetical protein